jgi:hypothetical protein
MVRRIPPDPVNNRRNGLGFGMRGFASIRVDGGCRHEDEAVRTETRAASEEAIDEMFRSNFVKCCFAETNAFRRRLEGSDGVPVREGIFSV